VADHRAADPNRSDDPAARAYRAPAVTRRAPVEPGLIGALPASSPFCAFFAPVTGGQKD